MREGATAPQVFISYRRHDAAAYAGRVFDALVERFGEDHVFIDVEAIEIGSDFEQVIVERVRRADVVLAVIGPQWLTATDDLGRRRIDAADDFVRRELEAALLGTGRVIPLLVQDARMPSAEELPESVASLCRRQAVVLSDRRWRADVGELVEDLAQLATADVGAAEWRASGLRPQDRLLNLPRHRTRFIGRDADMKRIDELLEATGFVTIVGPGGVGKSRLAIQVGRAREAKYADGVALADLATIDDSALVVQVVARATDVGEPAHDWTLDTLIDRLEHRRVLLILDNCEHLIDAAAAAAEALVHGVPGLDVVATSREVLRVDGEAVWRLEPLPVPSGEHPPTAVELLDSAAAMLFADRAALADPSFTVDDETAPIIARVTAGLDGLPLALELAAASLRSVPLHDVVAALSDPSSAAPRRTSQRRQRTLWDTVDWSYELLDANERLVLERLGVFAGHFSVVDAERVCGTGLAPGAVSATLARLVERCLVDPVDAREPGGARWRLLYSIRDYARTRLSARADDPTPAQLQAWAVDVARTNGRAVDVGDELAGLRVLDAEHPNLIAALALAVAADAGDTACRIASSLAPYWDLRGLRADGLAWIERAMSIAPPDDALRATCSLAAARLTATADFARRRQLCEHALAAANRAGDDALASIALAGLAHIDFETERWESARTSAAAALDRARAAGDDAAIALALSRLALCEQYTDARDRRHDLLTEAAQLYERLGSRRGQMWCLAEDGWTLLLDGAVDDASRVFRHGLELARELGYLHGEGWMLDALGETSGAAGHFADSRECFEAAHTIQVRLGDELNRGWTIGGAVRACLGTGDTDAALDWLQTGATHLRGDVGRLFEYAFLLRVGSTAMAMGSAQLAAMAVGALDARDPPATLSPMDLDDRRRLDAWVAAAPDAAALEVARRRGRDVAPHDLVRELLTGAEGGGGHERPGNPR